MEDDLEQVLRASVADSPKGSVEHRDAQWQLMRFLSLTGRPQEGLEILDALLTSTAEPGLRGEITLAMGQLLESADDFEGARAAYARGVALEPDNGDVWYLLHNNLGSCLNQLEQYAEAERWCRAAIQIEPLRHNAHKNLGLALQGQGRYVEAARSFIEAVHCEAGDPRALNHLREMVEAHPEIESDMPDVRQQMESCGDAVDVARAMLRKRPDGMRPELQ